MKVRTECGIRIGNLSRKELSPRGFVDFLGRHLHCFKFQPTQRLSDAFAEYGRVEVYVDGAAKLLLERPSFTADFISNQSAGMGITKNLLKVLEGKKMTVLFYEDGPLAILGRQTGPKPKALPRPIVPDLVEVIQQEVNRDFPRREKVDLDTIELGGLWSGSNTLLMAEILRSDGFKPSVDRFSDGQSERSIEPEDSIED